MAQHVEDKYAISLIDDPRDLRYRSIYACATSTDAQITPFHAHVMEAHEKRSIMLVAIVLEEYSLQGTDYPVTIQLMNGENELLGTACTRNKRTWSAVLLPGHQFRVEDKVLFEPPITHITRARQLFPDISDAESQRGIIKIESQGQKFWWLCTESINSEPDGALCPLGYAVAKSYDSDDFIKGRHHDHVERNYVVMMEREAMDTLIRFRNDAMDARPIVQLTSLHIHARSMHESGGPFVLGMKLGFFYYDS